MDKQTIKPIRLKKEAVVAKLTDKLNRAKSVVFSDYRGMTHKQIEGLKKAVKNFDAEFVVTKNTLLAKAMEKGSFKIADKNELKGPTVTLFSFSDVISPIKELAKTIKKLNIPVIKFGFLEGKKITSEDVLKLFEIPSKEVLLAQVVGGLKAPIFGLHRALNWNIQKLVLTFKAVEAKKQ